MTHAHDPDGNILMNYDSLDPGFEAEFAAGLFGENRPEAKMVVTEESNPAYVLRALACGERLTVYGKDGMYLGTFVPGN